MKAKIIEKIRLRLTISLVLGFTVLFYFLTGTIPNETNSLNPNTSPMPVSGSGDNFIIGAFQSGWDLGYNYQDTLGFNLWHIYNGSDTDAAGRHYPVGWIHQNLAPGDSLFAGYNDYVSQVQSVLGGVNSHNMKALMMRPKIEWLCFGQRSDYQCEVVSPNDDYWFYSFNEHDVAGQYGSNFYDNTVYGNNQWVRYCHPDPQNPQGGAGFVVRRLMANAEQTKSIGDFHGDSESDWLIKPRIRIDSTFAYNYQQTPVCSIKVIAQDGDSVLKEVVIKAGYFKDDENPYHGQYLEEFYFPPGTDLKIHGAWGTGWGIFTARGDNLESEASCLADIQVYWYGNCDMWIDYVRVDNDVASDLLSENPNNPKWIEYHNWLQWEAQDIACHLEGAASYRFYLELFEFNNIPCMAYVSHKLDSIMYSSCGKHISVLCIPIPFTYSGHVPWSDRLRVQNPGHLKRNFIDKMEALEFILGYYPFNSSYHHPEPDPYPTWSKRQICFDMCEII